MTHRSRGRVLVIGSINLDRTLTVPRAPEAGETISATGAQVAGGGKGANAALAARRAGAHTTFIGAVGDDGESERATRDLIEAGVDLRLISVAGQPTGSATILLEPSGQNRIVVYPGANHALTDTDVLNVAAALPRIDVVLTNLEVNDDVVMAAAEVAATASAHLIVNPAPARALPREILQAHAILTPNEEESCQLSREQSVDQAAEALHRLSGALVVVTRGARGVRLVSSEGSVDIAAPNIDAVDTTGAGDVFNGVFAAGIADGMTVFQAGVRAVSWASESARHRGARLPANLRLDAPENRRP